LISDEFSTIQGAVEFIESKKINSEIIVLQIGSNDLESAEVDDVMEKYENMVEIIKKEYSNAKLVIGEILPRHYHERLKTAEFEQVLSVIFCILIFCWRSHVD
jgi:hypothetical protein